MIDHLVVGAGIHGLCTAFALRQRSDRTITVVDQHGPGHTVGGSHGETRIFRASYAAPEYVRLAQEAHRRDWPALERALGLTLRTPTPGVFFGPAQGPFGPYLANSTTCPDLQRMPPAAARRRFPLVVEADDEVLLDASAAVIHAATTMRALREWLAAHGVVFAWNTRVSAVTPRADAIVLASGSGELAAGSLVLATGAWRLAPTIERDRTAVRQQVGFFTVDAPATSLAAGSFPVWARVGADADDFHYGLPAHAGLGLKAARHCTTGPGVDPDAPPEEIDGEALLAMARRRLALPVRGLQHAEHCLYGMVHDQELRVDRATALRPIVTIAACSGHGFKFGPVIGRLAADLLSS